VLHNSIAVELSFLGKGFQDQKVKASLKIVSCHAEAPLDNLV
jgi:hypothetical protein